MARIDITRTEIVWPGKYEEDGSLGRVPGTALPLEAAEIIGESRNTCGTGAGWRNKLIWGENLLVMHSLLEAFAGQIDLIYVDPPFGTGADFPFAAEIGDPGREQNGCPTIVEGKAYRDTWARGLEGYLDAIFPRLRLMRELLSPRGSIYVHLDARVAHPVKLLLDEVFGAGSFQREIIWRIGWVSGYKSAARNWIRNHDTILFYVKTPGDFTFNKEYVPYPPGYKRRGPGKAAGKGYPTEDVWNANPSEQQLKGEASLDSIQIKSFSREKTGYATQKNESLVGRILGASSNPGDLVADLFCGSGTTLAVAEKLGRRWIGCDLGRFAIQTARKRLLDIEGRGPFEISTLGAHERRHWQGATFGEGLAADERTRLAAYRAFVLDLHGAEPLAAPSCLHGRKGRAMVHIGTVDGPVTIDEIQEALGECDELGHSELHVLGWDWDMGIHDRVLPRLERRDVKLLLLQIPREVMERQAVEGGDIRFSEIPHLEMAVRRPRKQVATVSLRGFGFSADHLIPEDVRSKTKSWTDLIDYWAVDWDFREDVFRQGWAAWRTRKNRALALTSEPHAYERPGRYRIAVQVVDIFGNETRREQDIEIR